MWGWGWVEREISSLVEKSGAGGGTWIWGPGRRRWHVGVALGVTALAGLALAATLVISSRRGTLKSPWSRRKRKRALTTHQWYSFFTTDGKLRDGGVKFLKVVRSGGVDPSIRAEVWPFLLGVFISICHPIITPLAAALASSYSLNSSRADRTAVRQQKRKEYEKLRRRCRWILKLSNEGDRELKEIVQVGYAEGPIFIEGHESPASEDVFSAREPLSVDRGSPDDGNIEQPSQDGTSASNSCNVEEEDKSGITHVNDASAGETESSTEDEPESHLMYSGAEEYMENDPEYTSIKEDDPKSSRTAENFATWQRIIRLDAIRANAEWIVYSPAQALVSEDNALKSAVAVGLKDYDHLEPCRIYHAARLVAILEAYALYDPEIGYCQGMSDLLSPILAVMEQDYEAFWCFVGFMRKARHNFRLDEIGIRRQLNIVSRIIKSKDLHLYRHLEKLEAEDCFFVYRMVVVMFRRELTFEQTVCLWEVMWADQAAIRAGIGKSAWGRIRLRAPPTEDLLLYAIAACVLQRRKLIIETYSSMDEILRACNNMAGQLDVWKLLVDAHDLVVTLHDKIE